MCAHLVFRFNFKVFKKGIFYELCLHVVCHQFLYFSTLFHALFDNSEISALSLPYCIFFLSFYQYFHGIIRKQGSSQAVKWLSF